MGNKNARPTRLNRWQRAVVRILIVILSLCALVSAAAEVYVDSVHLPADETAPQASVLYYRDGRTIFARVGTPNHTDVPLDAVPVAVRHAVLAAEDRSFYSHGAVSTRGVLRAFVADVRGDDQGASTITQQYARNAYLTLTFSTGRKVKEFGLAVKLERRYTKDEILGRYLNTIYFGRGAYGIAAAADAYFGVPVDRLTAAQGAVLAAVIRDPWHNDPAVNPDDARARWAWIIAAMRAQGWLDDAAASAANYPQVRPRAASRESLSGPDGLVVDQVEQELESHGITPQMLHTQGLSVVTTLDPVAQPAALSVVGTALRDQPAGLQAALVAVDPATGGVRAYYGGDRGTGYFDYATAQRPPASTFKPIALAAGLRQGIGYLSRWDGRSPRTFPDRYGVPLNNHDGVQCPNCTLEQSMVQSLNTPFYALAEQIGADKVRDMAVALGIPDQYGKQRSLVDAKPDPRPGKTRADIAIGRYSVAPADLATVYATFAANGVRNSQHFVQTATAADHTVLWTATPQPHRVLDAHITADVSTVLQATVSGNGINAGRPAAGKTGTQQWGNTKDNQDAWMAGYTPQLAAVVWLGRPIPGPIREATGKPIEGETIPAQIWANFLREALNGHDRQAFPAPAHVGRSDLGDAGRVGLNGPGAHKSESEQGTGPVTHTAHSGKYLALTFDDGPSAYTPQILDLLARYHIKATFCVVGEDVSYYPSLVQRIVADGHRLCNHSTHHDDLGNASTTTIRNDLTTTDGLIAAAVPGATVTYFRAPGGSWGKSASVAVGLGHTPLGWAVDPEDWTTPGVDTIVTRVRSQLHPGDVVLLHDGGGNRQQTIDALNILIPQLLQDGWKFDWPQVTVPSHPLLPTTPTTTPSRTPGGTPTSTPSSTPSASGTSSGSATGTPSVPAPPQP